MQGARSALPLLVALISVNQLQLGYDIASGTEQFDNAISTDQVSCAYQYKFNFRIIEHRFNLRIQRRFRCRSKES